MFAWIYRTDLLKPSQTCNSLSEDGYCVQAAISRAGNCTFPISVLLFSSFPCLILAVWLPSLATAALFIIAIQRTQDNKTWLVSHLLALRELLIINDLHPRDLNNAYPWNDAVLCLLRVLPLPGFWPNPSSSTSSSQGQSCHPACSVLCLFGLSKTFIRSHRKS